MATATLQNSYHMLVLFEKHLVEEKVEVDHSHLPDDREKLTKPRVRLLRRGGVKDPRVLVIVQLWVTCGVAVHLTELIRILVLRRGVEDEDWKPHAVESYLANVLYMLQ